MRSNFSLRTATAVVGLLGLASVGLGQAVPTPAWTADSTTLSGHAAGPVLDTRLSPNGLFVASVVTKAGTSGGLEVRVRNASDGTFLWSADMGPAPTSGLPRLAFSNDSTRLYFSSDADAGVPFDGQLEARVPLTGANVAGFPINDANTDFIKTRVVTSPNGTWYAYQDGRIPTGTLQHQIIVRNTAGNAVYATINIGGSGIFPDLRDFQFTNNGTDGELIIAQGNGDFYKVNLNTGALVSYSTTTGTAVNRIERIPGDTTSFMVARESGNTLESLTYAAGALTRNYTNAPAGAKRGVAFLGTTTSTGVAYMVGAVGVFNFPTFLRVDNGDLIVQYDVRRTGEAAADSQMNTIAGAGAGGVFFGANSNERVISVARPEYSLSLNPITIIGGNTTTGTITLPGVAPAGGYLVNLTYGANASGPATATVPAGDQTVDFTVNSLTVDANTPTTVQANFPHTFDNDALNLTPVLVSSVAITPDPAPNSSNTTGSVTLNAAVTSDRVVSLAWTPGGNFALAPTSVTVLAGSSTANFTFRSTVVPAGFAASVTAGLNSSSVVQNFNVAAVSLESTQVYPANAYTGQRVFGAVRLSAPRASDLNVVVTSSNTSILAHQNVLIPAGQTYGVFSAVLGTPSSLDRFTNVTLTSAGGGESRTDVFQVRPPTNALASGYNLYSTVGDGLTRNREAFSVMGTTENILQVVVAANVTLVLKSDGTVWSVGQGTFGQHGDGTSGVSAVKTVLSQVPGLPVIKQIASTAPTVLALDANGEVWAWGQNSAGQTGQTPFGNTTVPTKVPSLANVAQIACSAFAGFALDTNGDVWSWGSNASGAGARGGAGTNRIPTKLTTVAGPFVELGVGNQFGFAIHADGSLYGWGLNTNGQLGLGDLTNRTVMTLVPVSNVRQIAGGVQFSVLLRTPPHNASRQVLTTGNNLNGQRGQGTVGGADTSTFASVSGGAANATQIGAGNKHAFYIGAAAVRSWGYGVQGERADGTFTTSNGTPVIIPSTVSVSNILAGASNSAALTALRNKGRNEALLTNGTNVQSANFRTGAITTLTGATIPAGHTVVGGGEVAGSTGTGEIITMDGARALFRQEVITNTVQASTALGITLGANESLVGVANFDNAGRMDFITVDSSTGAVAARLYNGTAQTGTYNLYTLGANEMVAGVGDFNQDGFQDLMLFNTSTRVLSVRLYRLSVFQSLTSFVTAPLTPTNPAAIPAVAAGLTPIAAAETSSGYGYNLVFDNSGAFEVWQLSRLNRVTTGLAGPTIPGGYSFVAFWR